MRKWLRQLISVDDPELRKKVEAAKKCEDQDLFNRPNLKSESIARALDLACEVGKTEQDRETNLNARAVAVASVAGLIVPVSGAVATFVFQEKNWTDWTKIATLFLFLWGFVWVAMAMRMAVFKVLRPKRGPTTKNFLGENLVNLWLDRQPTLLVEADKDRLNRLWLDSILRTLPQWHFRNRSKAQWLRRSWVVLVYGTVLIAFAAVFVIIHRLDITEPQNSGLATELPRFLLRHIEVVIVGTILGAALVNWIAPKRD